VRYKIPLPFGKTNIKWKEFEKKRECTKMKIKQIFDSTPGQYCFALFGAHQQECREN
jgi:hypothetical protein